MKKIKQKRIINFIKKAVFVLPGVFPPVLNASAQTMEKIPGQEEESSNLVEYLNNLYLFGLSAVAILAVFMIALGAFTYLVTAVGNPSKMQTAKEYITNALFGLALAFLAYLILYVVNPDLVGGTLGEPGEVVEEILGEESWDEDYVK
ncbi:MAG: hypothetical protein R6V40_00735 [Candidatus Moraniibacteriota bacterium]